MQINLLSLDNFRNYDFLEMDFLPGVNIIYGLNAQGKTNILEAIYMCVTGKSHRGSKEEEIIKFGKNEAHIKGEFEVSGIKKRIDIHLKRNISKGIALNQIPVKKISSLYGEVSVVIFSPEDLEIIKRGPSARRDFMNIELCQLDKVYVDNLIKYSKTVKQRNELLKKLEFSDEREKLEETLDVWDLQLVKYGTEIIERRKKFIEELNEIILDIHYEISGREEKLEIKYEPSADTDDFYEKLIIARNKDKIYKSTSVGPHRDDLSFYVNGKNMKIFGSQGQQRTSVLSLKLSEIEIIKKQKGDLPVLLLDDVLSELDRNRQKELLKRIGSMQTIITCTGIDEFVENETLGAKKFHIKNAKKVF